MPRKKENKKADEATALFSKAEVVRNMAMSVGLSPEKLARKAGIAKQVVSDGLNGAPLPPEILNRLAAAASKEGYLEFLANSTTPPEDLDASRENFLALLEEAGLTLAEFARYIGVNAHTASFWGREKDGKPVKVPKYAIAYLLLLNHGKQNIRELYQRLC